MASRLTRAEIGAILTLHKSQHSNRAVSPGILRRPAHGRGVVPGPAIRVSSAPLKRGDMESRVRWPSFVWRYAEALGWS